jgi:predicted deacylase
MMKANEFDVNDLPVNDKHQIWLDIAPRADVGAWQLPMLCVCGATTGPRLTIFGAVHGDEYDGPEVIYRIFERVRPAELRGVLQMIPVCNIPAYESIQRNSPIDGKNLARVFPGTPDGTLTEQIAYWLTEKCIRGADLLLDIHSAGLAYDLPNLVGWTHSPAPHHQASERAARAFGAPVVWAHPAPVPPGRSLSAADDLGVPAFYTEAPGAGRVNAETLNLFVRGVMNVLRHMNMIEAKPDFEPPQIELIGNGNLDHIIFAPCAGHFRADVRLLQTVEAGQQLGAIYDLVGNVLATIYAPATGSVILLRALHRVNVGEGVVHLTNKNNKQ